jgi:RNA recognition motif-containing protein
MPDRDFGNSRGFGYVTYASPMGASAAIGALNNQD